jgi:hypothetical protein
LQHVQALRLLLIEVARKPRLKLMLSAPATVTAMTVQHARITRNNLKVMLSLTARLNRLAWRMFIESL